MRRAQGDRARCGGSDIVSLLSPLASAGSPLLLHDLFAIPAPDANNCNITV